MSGILVCGILLELSKWTKTVFIRVQTYLMLQLEKRKKKILVSTLLISDAPPLLCPP